MDSGPRCLKMRSSSCDQPPWQLPRWQVDGSALENLSSAIYGALGYSGPRDREYIPSMSKVAARLLRVLQRRLARSRRGLSPALLLECFGAALPLAQHSRPCADHAPCGWRWLMVEGVECIGPQRFTTFHNAMSFQVPFCDGFLQLHCCTAQNVANSCREPIQRILQHLLPRASDLRPGQLVALVELCALAWEGATEEDQKATTALSPGVRKVRSEKIRDEKVRREKLRDEKVRREEMQVREKVFLKASSVHEKGLHGQVRNVTFDPSAFATGHVDGRPTLPFSAGALEPSDGQVLERDEKANPPKAGESIGATPVVLGLPISDRRAEFAKDAKDAKVQAIAEDEEHPRSPQCMTSQGPQAAMVMASEAVLGFAAAEEAPPDENLERAEGFEPEMKGIEAIAKHPDVKLVRGPTLWCQQFDALFRKRALSVRRDRRAWASQLLLPSIFVFLALLTARILEVKIDEPPLKLSTDMLSGTVWAGSARVIQTHEIPFSKELKGALAENVYEAFDKGKGSRDSLDLLGGNETMGRYLLEERSNDNLGTSYGAISLSGEEKGQANLTLWFSRQAYHGVPVMVNLWNNARMQLLGMGQSNVQVFSHPLPKTQQLVQEEMSGGRHVTRAPTELPPKAGSELDSVAALPPP
eukprot:s21_g40.t1